jgi:hypothetical protein
MASIIRDDLASLREKLMSVEREFEERLQEVEIKTKDFRQMDAKLEERRQEKDFQIKINVGGKNFVTKLSTLLGVKDTLFYNLLANYVKKDLEIPGEIFFDRNYTYFPLVLEYLRHKNVSMKGYDKFQKDDIIEDFEFFGIDIFGRTKNEIEINWDIALSKAGNCSINGDDGRSLKVHSTSCYTHFLTDRLFTDENFIIEFETTVVQTDSYYYIGLINESYNTTSNCGCCSPANSYYIQCDGTVHINSSKINSPLQWNSEKCIIGMRVILSEKVIYFYKDSPDNEFGPYIISTGTNFRVYAGHCNTGNGNLNILTCRYI